MALIEKLQAIADAIRFKTNKIGQLTLDEMPTEILSISGGSTDVPFPLGGMNAELVSEYNEDYTLADTSFVKGETASTSSTIILASVSNKYTNTTGSPTYNYGDKDIVVVQTINAEVEHEEGASNIAKMLKSSYVMLSWFSKRKTTDTSAKTTRQVYGTSTGYLAMKYYNSSGALSRTINTAYGFYGTPQMPSVSSATSNSAYVRVSSPAIACRVSSTYESSANMRLVKDVNWHWNVKVYAVDSMTSPSSVINDIQDEWLTD